jgi:hypothetical protein
MNRFVNRWTAGLTLALGLTVLASAVVARDDEEDQKKIVAKTQEVGKVFSKFSEELATMKEADAKKAAKEFAEKNPIEYIMYQFKPRARSGGLGVGKLTDKITPDAIELKIMAMADPKKKLSAGEITRLQAAYIEMAQRTAAVAELTHVYTPKEKKPGKDPKDWTKFTEDMQKGSKELIEALKKKDEKAVFTAAGKLNASCNDCHAIFRDTKG